MRDRQAPAGRIRGWCGCWRDRRRASRLRGAAPASHRRCHPDAPMRRAARSRGGRCRFPSHRGRPSRPDSGSSHAGLSPHHRAPAPRRGSFPARAESGPEAPRWRLRVKVTTRIRSRGRSSSMTRRATEGGEGVGLPGTRARLDECRSAAVEREVERRPFRRGGRAMHHVHGCASTSGTTSSTASSSNARVSESSPPQARPW